MLNSQERKAITTRLIEISNDLLDEKHAEKRVELESEALALELRLYH